MQINSSPDTFQNNSNKSTSQIFAVQATFGPIPPPEVLAKYEELKLGLAERIVRMAELLEHILHLKDMKLQEVLSVCQE